MEWDKLSCIFDSKMSNIHNNLSQNLSFFIKTSPLLPIY